MNSEALLNGLGVVIGAAILYVLSRTRHRLEKRNDKQDQRLEGIDKAVNSRPPDQPSLYDMVQTMDLKMDNGFAALDRRVSGIDDRIKGLDDRIDGVDERTRP